MKSLVKPRSFRPLGSRAASLSAAAFIGVLAAGQACAEQPPPPCHPNPNAAADGALVSQRGDIAPRPDPLQDLLQRMAERPHPFLFANSGLCRGRQTEPAVPVLPAVH